MQYISILSTVVTFVFAVAVFNRYRQKGGMHLLLWGIGLILFGLGTLSEAILIFTYSELVLKMWYLCGAMLTAAWLGQGTVHLLIRKRGVAMRLTLALLIVSLVALVLVVMASPNPAAPPYDSSLPISAQYKDLLVRNPLIIILTILLNTYGAFALIGGALYSAYIFWRKRVLADRMYGNILIAAGALMPTLGGTFIRLGLGDWLYLSEFLGVILMYAGFLKATATQPTKQAVKAPAPSH